MRNYVFFPSLLTRIPLYSFGEYENADYPSIIKSDAFKAALLLASTSFYKEVEKKQFDYHSLNDKQRSTLKKYMNRASFRSTPFGLFSSFALVNWVDESDTRVILSEPKAHIQLDFGVLQALWSTFLKDRMTKSVRLQTNPSIYFSKIDFRYIKTEIEGADTLFSMVSITKNVILKRVLKFCRQGRSPEEIRSFLLTETGVTAEEAEAFLLELTIQQIIVPSNAPNVTGEDYSDLFFTYLEESHGNSEIKKAKFHFNELSGHSCNLPRLSTLAHILAENLPKGNDRNYFYAVSKREALQGGIACTYQRHIQDGLYCLGLLAKAPVMDDLETFKAAFSEKYESEYVPLLEVLDSQFGVGYGAFEKIKDKYGFDYMSYGSAEDSGLPVRNEKKDVLALLLNEWQLKNAYEWKYELEITDKLLEKIETENDQDKLPPSISVMFRTLGQEIFLECAGGPSALSLIGRFSYAHEVFAFAKQIAEKEQKLNKDIAFAEIAHICNLHSANINRRAHLRDFEIPVLTCSTIDDDKQIHLSDILVSVREGTVVLRSKKLKKNIIPRLSSAFNYTKNSFPIFRFLCDVQNQQLKANFSFSLASLVPGLKFYPRVRYRSCVLQLAEWHLETTAFNFLQGKEHQEAYKLFCEFARRINLPRYFTYSLYDNFLVFDSQKIDDISFFLREAGNKGTIVVKEFPFLKEDSAVTDSFHRPFMAQHIASLYLNEEVYKTTPEHHKGKNQPARVTDTRDWIYFKIYCHPLSSDIILCDYLLPLIKKYNKARNVIQWFWIRYNDPEYHIRFRIKPSGALKAVIFEAFITCFNKLALCRLVSSFHTDIYKREIERYSPELIQDVESVFTSSSTLVGNFLKRKHTASYGEDEVMIEALFSVNKMLDCFGFCDREKVEFCKFQFYQFFAEFGAPKTLKPEVEKLHRRLHAEVVELPDRDNEKRIYKLLERRITHLVQRLAAKKVKGTTPEKLAADIIHMHLNRLYVHHQRHYEMVTYFLLYRSLSAQMHRKQEG